MKHSDMSKAVDEVLSGRSMHSVAKEYGLSASSLRVKVRAHPNYESAKSQGLLHERKGPMEPTFTDEQLRQHPAVLAVVGGSSIHRESKLANLEQKTLQRWVHRAFPNYVNPRASVRPQPQPQSQLHPAHEQDLVGPVDPLLAELIRTAAKQKGVDPRRLCAGLLSHFRAEG